MSGQSNIASDLNKKRPNWCISNMTHQQFGCFGDNFNHWVNISFQNREINRSSDQARQYRSAEQVGGILLGWNYSGHGQNRAHAANSWVRPRQKPAGLRKAWPKSCWQYNAYQTEHGVLETEGAGDFGQRKESCPPPSSSGLKTLILFPPHPLIKIQDPPSPSIKTSIFPSLD